MSVPAGAILSASTSALLKALLDGGAAARPALARAITLAESSLPAHGAQAAALLDSLLAARARERALVSSADAPWRVPPAHALPPPPPCPRTLRVGLAGAPGAGKSSLIEALGMFICSGGAGGLPPAVVGEVALPPGPGLRVAVLAVDPSSARTGGAILGDATRMPRLTRCPLAYVRPSAARGNLGGVARHSNDAVLLCEGAGYDVVLVETVGLGQSEVAIEATVDMTLLLVAPGGGDELQASKKGIVEIADAIVVSKCDGGGGTPASLAAAEYGRALGLLRPRHTATAAAAAAAAAPCAPQVSQAALAALPWRPPVLRVSAVDPTAGDGVVGLWRACEDFWRRVGGSGLLAARRRAQSLAWAHSELESRLVDAARASPRVSVTAARLNSALADGDITPRRAGELLRNAFYEEVREG